MKFKKKNTTNNKIELICYASNDITYTYDNDYKRFYLMEPLKFIPYDMGFEEDEIKHLIDVCFTDPKLKITIERI